MPLDMQNAAKTGTVNIMPDNDAMDFGNAVNPETDTPPPVGIPKSEQKATDKTKYIEEEKDAITSLIQNEVAEESEEINYAKTGANITSAQRKVQAVKETRIKNAKMMQIDITETEKTLKYQHWTILKVIGETGACEISEIISLCSDSSKKDNNNLSESTIKHTCTALINKQCIGRDEIKHPIKSNFFVYSLTEIGKQLYTDKFGKKPVISEKNILIAQHDNLEHAFGIKELKRIIESTNKFSDISMDRKTNTIKLKDGNIYIPDIIAQPKGKPYKMYFEYERGTHHQSDFDAKMNKAAKNNPYVNIVVPNSDTARDLVNKVNSWIESRGGYNSLKNNGIKIRITPLRYLEGKDNINNDGYWQFVYNLRNSIEPMENQFRGKEE
jgi:predicted DNA-binding ribbon-helix-helix protein